MTDADGANWPPEMNPRYKHIEERDYGTPPSPLQPEPEEDVGPPAPGTGDDLPNPEIGMKC